WDRHRVTLTWNYRNATDTPTSWAATANAQGTTGPELMKHPLNAGYKPVHLFNLTAGTRLFDVLSASVSISNLFDKKPRPGGYELPAPRKGFCSFSPFGDLVVRRYSLTLSAEFCAAPRQVRQFPVEYSFQQGSKTRKRRAIPAVSPFPCPPGQHEAGRKTVQK